MQHKGCSCDLLELGRARRFCRVRPLHLEGYDLLIPPVRWFLRQVPVFHFRGQVFEGRSGGEAGLFGEEDPLCDLLAHCLLWAHVLVEELFLVTARDLDGQTKPGVEHFPNGWSLGLEEGQWIGIVCRELDTLRWRAAEKGREGGGGRVGWRVGGERYVHCMYANFVFALVKEGGCGGRGKSECVCV